MDNPADRLDPLSPFQKTRQERLTEYFYWLVVNRRFADYLYPPTPEFYKKQPWDKMEQYGNALFRTINVLREIFDHQTTEDPLVIFMTAKVSAFKKAGFGLTDLAVKDVSETLSKCYQSVKTQNDKFPYSKNAAHDTAH